MSKFVLFLRYWSELFLARVFSLLPIDVASGIGAAIARYEVTRALKLQRKWVMRLHHNFEQLEGIKDSNSRVQRILQHAEHLGRLYAEYPVLHKIANKRLTVKGEEYLQGLSGPAIFVSAHTGQWELILEVMRRSQVSTALLYDPIPNKVFLKVAMEVRKHLCPEAKGNKFIPASASAARELVGCLKAGENLVIFIDEDKGGLVWSPALGRKIPFAGNRMMAARLAVKFQVPIVPIHLKRKGGAQFEAVVEQPICPGNDEYESATELAVRLNTILGKWLEEDYADWYWLARLNLEREFPDKYFKVKN
ncbi:lysophospholipid acyltransferase family protein [Amphritea sp.]|uniref:lysophospholipid acyltransferase family protein n=1 Tax=Amphritea sp. TaxID=1872502 RepID=UPI0025C322F1|nr:lysophospholipid acyltransferase family protein [Amphritea sp.]